MASNHTSPNAPRPMIFTVANWDLSIVMRLLRRNSDSCRINNAYIENVSVNLLGQNLAQVHTLLLFQTHLIHFSLELIRGLSKNKSHR